MSTSEFPAYRLLSDGVHRQDRMRRAIAAYKAGKF